MKRKSKGKSINDILNEIGMTYNEVSDWLKASCVNNQSSEDFSKPACSECGVPGCMATQKRKKQDTSNVHFIPGDHVEDTQVYVAGVKVEGVIKANLEYDSEYSRPVLKLVVLAPKVGEDLGASAYGW